MTLYDILPEEELRKLYSKGGLKAVLNSLTDDVEGSQYLLVLFKFISWEFDTVKEEELRKRGFPIGRIREIQAIDAIVFQKIYFGAEGE